MHPNRTSVDFFGVASFIIISFQLLFSLFSMTRLGNTKEVVLSRCRLLINMTKWRKVVVLLREYKNMSNMSFKIYTTSLSNIDHMK